LKTFGKIISCLLITFLVSILVAKGLIVVYASDETSNNDNNNAIIFSSNLIQSKRYTLDTSNFYTYPVFDKLDLIEKQEAERMREEEEIMILSKQIAQLYTKHNSPMVEYSEFIVRTARKQGVDPKLVVAISIVESGGGKVNFRAYNPFGWGQRDFTNYYNAIEVVTSGLNNGYYAKGLDTVQKIGPVYNAGDSNEWIRKINDIIKQI